MATPNHSAGPTARLAAFVASRNQTKLPDDLSLRAAIALLDAFGLALAARGDTTFEAFVDLAKELAHPNEGCTIWGRSQYVSLLDGVTANGIAVHARFQDDCDMTSWAHPGSLIVPPAVSLGELMNADIATVFQAIVCGYAVVSWLGGEEIVSRKVVGRGFRASPVFGSIGAAAAASVILELDEQQSLNALAIAADTMGGVLEPVGAGADDWRVQNGTAAHRGVLAALLAQRGVVGAPMALEGKSGLLHAFAGLEVVPSVWERDPDSRSILNVWAKPYPTLGDNVAVVAAALALRDGGLDVDAIESVEVHQNAHFASYPGTSYRGPYIRPAQATASTAFAVAATLLYGSLKYEIYSTRLNDPQINDLIQRLKVVPEENFSYIDGMVEILLADGSKVRQAAAALPRSLFYRDRTSAVEAFTSLLLETGYGEELIHEVSAAVFAGIEDNRGVSIRSVLEKLKVGSNGNGFEPK